MIYYQILSFVRSFTREKKLRLINITGLSIGIAAFLLIGLYIKSELEFDQFHENSHRIYRVLQHSKSPANDIIWTRSGPGMAPVAVEKLPDVEEAVRILAGKNVLDSDPLVTRGKVQFLEPNLCYADPGFFRVFSFETLNGGPIDFTDPYSIVITESTAKKYFGEEEAIGQTLDIANQGIYTVEQVILDFPTNSHFHFDLIANLQSHSVYENTNWGWTRVYTYLLLHEKASVSRVEAHLQSEIEAAFANKDFGGNTFEQWKAAGNSVSLNLQPLESIHLYSKHASEFEPGGDIRYVRLFFIVALMILFLACINFVNLSTAQTAKRAKEVGVKKTLGATRSQLIFQLIFESFLTCLLAAILAMVITSLLFPILYDLLGNRIASPIFHWSWLVLGFVFISILGLIAGAYPAIYLSHFQAAKVIKSGGLGEKRKPVLRNVLTVFQFCTSIGLIVATLTIYHQVQHMKNKDRGFARQLLVLDRANVLDSKTEIFKQNLIDHPLIESVASSTTVPGSWIGSVSLYPLSGTVADRVVVYPIFTDYDFDETYNFEFVQGRGFSKDYASDSLAVIINETALKAFGLESIEGEYLKGWLQTPHPIVGVIKDFNQKSAREKIDPMVLFVNFFPTSQNMTIRFSGADISASIAAVKHAWERFVPSEPMIYFFLDDNFDRLYSNEIETGNLFVIFSLVAILIAALGLFGMATFAAEQRSKEFAIRKVLGATARNIFSMMVKDFGKLMFVAFLLSIPVVWMLMENWLENFAYRTSIPIWTFFVAGLTGLAVVALSITGQSLKTAFENPVKKLRDD